MTDRDAKHPTGPLPRNADGSLITTPRTRTADLAQRMDDELAAEVAVLLQELNRPDPLKNKVRQELALNHAYTRLAATGIVPSFSAFRSLANDRYSWAYGEFVYWAKDKSWDHVRTDT